MYKIFKVEIEGIQGIRYYRINPERATKIEEKYIYEFKSNVVQLGKILPFLLGEQGFVECSISIANDLGIPYEYIVRTPYTTLNMLFKQFNAPNPGDYLYDLVKLPEKITFEKTCNNSILEVCPEIKDVVVILKDLRCSIYNDKLNFGPYREAKYPTMYFEWNMDLINKYIKTKEFILQMRYLSILIYKYFVYEDKTL